MVKLGIAGYSGSGKTTLVTRLIPALMARGLTVSTVKHTHHSVHLDRRGDASRRLTAAGAKEVAISTPDRWARLRELRGAPEPDVEGLTAMMDPVDLVLVEGFKRHRHEKIEVHRPDHGKPPLWPDDPMIVAVASDRPLDGLTLPSLDLDDVAAVADFIVERYALNKS